MFLPLVFLSGRAFSAFVLNCSVFHSKPSTFLTHSLRAWRPFLILCGSRGCPKWHLSLNLHSFPSVDLVIQIGVSLLSPSRRIGGGTATPNSAPIRGAWPVFDVILKIPCSFRWFGARSLLRAPCLDGSLAFLGRVLSVFFGILFSSLVGNSFL